LDEGLKLVVDEIRRELEEVELKVGHPPSPALPAEGREPEEGFGGAEGREPDYRIEER
jgi:hypothetical protein